MKLSTSAAASRTMLAARAEASAWITRLHGPNRSAETEAGFRRWLAERPENAREFEALTEIWDLIAGGAPADGAPRLERWEHSQESRELQALRGLRRLKHRSARHIWASAASIVLACGLMALGAYRFWAVSSYSTGIGEQRIVQLDDGTRVSLNSDTRVRVAYARVQRRVQLEHGEAFFQVARDPARPFVVVAGGRQVTALGTSFIVRYEPERTAVTLVEGKVAVAPIAVAAPSLPAKAERTPTTVSSVRTLSAGERLTFTADGPPVLDQPRIESVTAWRRGEVVLDDTPLIEAVAEMNRYDRTAIVIDSPEIEGLIVSGLYHAGDSEGFARSVAKMYALEVAQDEGRIHLRSR